jgi:outer membrane protein W
MRKLTIALAVLAAALVVAQPATAQDNNWKLFGGATYVTPMSDEDIDLGAGLDTVELSDEAGFVGGIEWRWNKLLALQGDVMWSSSDVEYGNNDSFAEIDMMPITLGLNFHLIPSKFFDLYVGPTASWVSWGDLEEQGGAESSVDDEFAYGAQIGLDLSFAESWAVVTGVRYLQLDAEDVSVDPLFWTLGLGFRW